MDELIINIDSNKNWPLEGRVYSDLFKHHINFFAEHRDVEYAKACAEYLNLFSSDLIDQLCRASIRYCNEFLEEVGEPVIEFASIRDVLKIVSPNFINIPEPNENKNPVIHMDLNCEWEPEHGMEWIIRDGEVLYVGQYSAEDPWADYSVKDKWNYA